MVFFVFWVIRRNLNDAESSFALRYDWDDSSLLLSVVYQEYMFTKIYIFRFVSKIKGKVMAVRVNVFV